MPSASSSTDVGGNGKSGESGELVRAQAYTNNFRNFISALIHH